MSKKAQSTNVVPYEEKIEGPHQFVSVCKSKPGMLTCKRCGFGLLKNQISELVNRIGCAYAKHPTYRAWVTRGYKF